MLPQHVLLALVGACTAVPLNINLGAYSPALVVGDGEISLGSAESASGLMATLASGAAEGQPQGQQEQQQQPPAAPPAPPAEANQEPPAEANAENAAKRDLSAVLKRSPANEHIDAISHAMEWIKRDLPGFNAALAYAREAMQNTPKIEMGSEGAGVGIIVNAGLNVPANSAANGQPPAGEKKAKRDEVVAEEGEAPKMTLVAITEV
ncbi:hypothetical protein BU24DRAFT_228332 [Aaosphaeria arxii CBS 175.79]|uniref:Uncharacterized protein n=1 Tax=Aaosphaeria arxii CBS 175.79 TaxID=1450172 RepID=A0A6A5XQE1_9PLEO|nr:uncharacterized protein BU24DRAFT_228332 [Aaosphaeria arxii CBS 175.79]KAF2015109.1 hypothetical protein BU24DRAFT_228332 [Aaosphaeria arxii CBS 175.79]